MDNGILFDGAKPESLNVSFKGSYVLMKWILKKYEKELPYGGGIIEFARANKYTKNISYAWEHYGVPPRAWNGLHKDLVIFFLIGKIKSPMTLQQLKEEFDQSQTAKDLVIIGSALRFEEK